MKPMIISHRGKGNSHPENTIEACEQAILDGADILEVDVQQTFKGNLVVFHDFTLKRMLRGKRRALLWTSSHKLNQYRIEDKYEIPTLKDFIEHFKGRIPINLDAKLIWPLTGPFARDIVRAIVGWKAEDQIWVSSFNSLLLGTIKYNKKRIKTGLLFKKNAPFYLSLNNLWQNDAWHPAYPLLNEKMVQEAKKNGKELYVWTVNEKDKLERLKNFDGLNGVVTDNPKLAKSVF
jgi:glycerophosphoryl diester phosphodiesterase